MKYCAEKKRIREQEIGRKIERAIEDLRNIGDGEEFKVCLKRIAENLERFGSTDELNANPDVGQLINNLVEVLAADREHRALKKFFQEVISIIVNQKERSGFLSSEIAADLRERYDLDIDAVTKLPCINAMTKKFAIDSTRVSFLAIKIDCTLSPAENIVRLFALEGITLNLED